MNTAGGIFGGNIQSWQTPDGNAVLAEWLIPILYLLMLFTGNKMNKL